VDTARWDRAVVRGRDRPRVVGFLTGAVVGMAVLGLVWMWVAGLQHGDVTFTGKDADATAPAALPTSTPTLRDEGAAASTPLESCRRLDDRVRDALRAASPALSQWEIHVGAMNKLVAGVITLRQANAFWNNTRFAAQQNLATFRAAERRASRADRTDARCPRPMSRMSGMSGTAGMKHSPKLASCARREAADQRALDAADTAIATWSHHVTAMNMLRMGHLSPARAGRMWLRSWREGVRQIRAYHEAARAARTSGVC
jgi:hypothetical protein